MGRAFELNSNFDDFRLVLDISANVSSSFPETLEHFYVNVPPVQYNVGYKVSKSEPYWVLGLRRMHLDLVHDRTVPLSAFVECQPSETEIEDDTALVDDVFERLQDNSLLYDAAKYFLNITNPKAFEVEDDFMEKMQGAIAFLREIALSIEARYDTADSCALGLFHPLFKFFAAQIWDQRAHLELWARDDSFFSYLLGLEHTLNVFHHSRSTNTGRRSLTDQEEDVCATDHGADSSSSNCKLLGR